MANCGDFKHIVKQGDTLGSISEIYKLSLEDILAVNPEISDVNNLQVGQEVCLPSVIARRESLTYLYGGTTDFYLGLISKKN